MLARLKKENPTRLSVINLLLEAWFKIIWYSALAIVLEIPSSELDVISATYSSTEARLKELRQESGLTIEAFANEVGVSKSSIGYYENQNRLPDIATAARMAGYCA